VVVFVSRLAAVSLVALVVALGTLAVATRADAAADCDVAFDVEICRAIEDVRSDLADLEDANETSRAHLEEVAVGVWVLAGVCAAAIAAPAFYRGFRWWSE
jgi:hypothetical protein